MVAESLVASAESEKRDGEDGRDYKQQSMITLW